ncbi:MAG: CPBP family intramembrane metalloprotease [Chloroflexi bacterium]|nr:MAG: CPBP family intramembrane metalloprotease [Chloroflexota bacterium]MBL1192754.1 CPBP family intramembrane metalloprotease [Chloroflexota bacterium]NOH10048.1 CPBP family intramembrane metalloprotease [Chloroflexota bacterium]
MKNIVKKYQIIIFFIVTLIIGWFPWYMGQGSIIFAAPLISALIVAFLADGWEGILDILRRMGRWRANWRWYVFILFSPAVLYLVAVGVHVLLGRTAPQFPLLRENQYFILITFIVFLLPWQSSAFLEEVGFRGYALEKLQNKWGPLAGTLILGAFFGAWLLPEFFQPDSFQSAMGGMSFFPWFVLTEIGWSILMTWAYNHTGKSALIAGYLFHTAFNTWTFVMLTNAIPGEDLPALDTTLFIIAGVVVALAGVVLVIATKGKLGYSEAS